MTLEVIGAGFGRTGTISLKVALETLGFGPCYHMIELFQNPEHLELWEAAARGAPVNWEELFINCTNRQHPEGPLLRHAG